MLYKRVIFARAYGFVKTKLARWRALFSEFSPERSAVAFLLLVAFLTCLIAVIPIIALAVISAHVALVFMP